jgi:hypothetical protein
MNTKQKKNLTVATALLFFFSFASGTWADKLDDFKSAVNSTGCKSIPYGDLQRNCEDQQKEVHKWCDGDRGPVSVEKGISSKLKRDSENEKKTYEELRRKKSDLEGAISRSSNEQEKTKLKNELEATQKDIYNSEKTIDNIKNALDKRKDLVEKAIYTIEKCIDFRRAVMNVFATALDRVRSENENAIAPLARTLRDRYEESKRGHEIAITDKNNALSTCRDERV